jgi:hypothetical protein
VLVPLGGDDDEERALAARTRAAGWPCASRRDEAPCRAAPAINTARGDAIQNRSRSTENDRFRPHRVVATSKLSPTQPNTFPSSIAVPGEIYEVILFILEARLMYLRERRGKDRH